MIKPLLNKVVLKMIEIEKVTIGGIILSETAKESSQMAIVVAVGPGDSVAGKEVNMQVNVNDKVIIKQCSGIEIKLDGEIYVVVSQEDILGIVL